MSRPDMIPSTTLYDGGVDISNCDQTLLDRVLSYENPELIERFKHKLGLSSEESEDLFYDMKQFLYLCGTRPGVWSPTQAIDAGWHEFVLYTQDYDKFCRDMFGRFIHHIPKLYLSDTDKLVGNTWRTYKVALHQFGKLSKNWEVPDSLRPADKRRFDNVTVLESDACNSCGCNSCNSCGAGNGCSSS